MDKVIIDKVDVSGCEFCSDNPLLEIKHSCKVRGYEKDNGLHTHFQCKNNPDCYYKQLKRLQAEYDDLHLNYAGCKTANTGLQELNEKLQAENERLKKELKDYKTSKENSYQNLQKEWQQLQWDIRKLTTENERLKARLRPLEDSYFKGLSSIEIAELAKKSIRITAENRKLEQALQEIREIAGFHISKDDSEDVQSDIQDILDKINEVIGAE